MYIRTIIIQIVKNDWGFINMQEKLEKYIIFKFFSITNGFTDVIGQGGYATVFKGVKYLFFLLSFPQKGREKYISFA